MNDVKPWYTSVGVWGGVIAMAVGILQSITGHSLGIEDQNAISQGIVQVLEVFGGAVAIYGRYKATTVIK